MADSGTPAPPVPTAVGLHEELWEARAKIRRIVGWARSVAVWQVALVIIGVVLFLAGVTFRVVTPGPGVAPGLLALAVGVAVALILIGVVVFAITGVFVLRDARAARQVLAGWEQGLLPFFYTVKFEMLPVSEADREADISKRYRSLFPTLPRLSLTHPLSGGVRLREAVRGKVGEHYFHVFGYVPHDLLLLVRRFTEAKPVSPADVQNLKAESEDILERWPADRVVVAAFSPQPFSPEAVELARSGHGLVRGHFPVGLIQETSTGYSVVSA